MPSFPPPRVLAALATFTCLAVEADTLTASARVSVSAPQLEDAPRVGVFAQAMEAGLEPATSMLRVEGFLNRTPRDDEPLSEATVAYLGRDARALYIVFMCFAKDVSALRAHRVARDKILDDDDSVAVQIDTYRDVRRAYGLQANVAGAKQDGYWIEGSGWSLDPDFDYRTEGALTSRGYVMKYTIPFASIDYPKAADTWGLLLMRVVPGTNEMAFWPRYSRNVQGRMNQAALLEGMADAPPPSRGAVVPYVTTRYTDLDGETTDDAEVGIDARLRVGHSTELALAINPDFSQVESDEPQIVANQRFELFFPEKRPFFSDHARYFKTPLDLLFTRRIANPKYGLKATGQGRSTTWGTLAVRDQPLDAPDRDLLAGRMRYDATPRLSFGAGGIWLGDDAQRNAVASVDTRWAASDRWTLLGQVATSRDTQEENTLRGSAAELRLQGSTPTWSYDLNVKAISDDFRADAGFVPRTGIIDSHQLASWRHYPKGSAFVAFGPDLTLDYVTDASGVRLDQGAELALVAEFAQLTTVSLFGGPRRARLLPEEFPGIAQALDFDASRVGARFATSFEYGALELELSRGLRINLVPLEGALPNQGRFQEATFTLGLRPSSSLTNENKVLYARLDDDASGVRVFEQIVARSKWSYYFTPEWSLRFIAQYQRTRANEVASRLEDDEGANLDVLMAWQPTPTRALYVGANTDYDVPLDDVQDSAGFPDRLERRAASVYVKFSWSFALGGE